MAYTFDQSAADGISYDLDGGTFDGPETLYIKDMAGIASAEVFGDIEKFNFEVTAVGITSGETFGSTVVAVAWPIQVFDSIASLEAFGVPQLNGYLHGTGILSAESFGVLEAYVQWEPDASALEDTWVEGSERSDPWTKETENETTWNT